MAVAVAPNFAPPITNAGKGANHQPVRGPATIATPGAGGGPVPVAPDLKGGIVGTAYSENISAQGGTGPYTFAVTGGALPAGTSMSSVGIVSGTPTTVSTNSFTVTVTDALAATGSQGFTIAIAAAAVSANYGYVN